MVRLKEMTKISDKIYEIIFQFHYGSVKRDFPNLSIKFTEKFQFHYGSVKSFTDGSCYYKTKVFQFHYGSVKS